MINGTTEQAATVVRSALWLYRWSMWLFSSSVAYAYLAAGRIAGSVHFATSSPVHTAAGCFVAEAAGAVVTDLAEGGPWPLDSRSCLLAATPALHRELWDLVAQSQ